MSALLRLLLLLFSLLLQLLFLLRYVFVLFRRDIQLMLPLLPLSLFFRCAH